MGRKVNIKVEAMQAQQSNAVLLHIFRFAYDWRLAYGFGPAFFEHAADVIAENDPGFPKRAHKTWYRFIALLLKCADRDGITDKIKNRMIVLLRRLPPDYRWVAYNILKKDLRIGVNTGLIKRVWPHAVPEFKVRCCASIKPDATDGDVLTLLPLRWLAAPKVDGLRMLVEVHDARKGTGVVRSRKGLEQPQLLYLLKEASRIIKAAGMESGALDCEGRDRNSLTWGAAMTAATTQDIDDDERTLLCEVFDIIPLEQLHAGRGESTQRQRYNVLRRAFKVAGKRLRHFKRFSFLKHKKGESKADGWKRLLVRYNELRHEGYEGIVIYDLDAEYRAGSGTADRKNGGLRRIKPFNFRDVTITGCYKGKPGTKYSSCLGGFKCRTEDGVDIRVGGGFKEHERLSFWKDRKSLIGRTIVIDAQEGAVGIKQRHANFRRLRPAGDK